MVQPEHRKLAFKEKYVISMLKIFHYKALGTTSSAIGPTHDGFASTQFRTRFVVSTSSGQPKHCRCNFECHYLAQKEDSSAVRYH